jgi:hypothetical protein
MAWCLPPERPSTAPPPEQRLRRLRSRPRRLGLDRSRRSKCRIVSLARTGDVALGREHVATDLLEDRREGAGVRDIEQLERIVVLALFGEHAGQA